MHGTFLDGRRIPANEEVPLNLDGYELYLGNVIAARIGTEPPSAQIQANQHDGSSIGTTTTHGWLGRNAVKPSDAWCPRVPCAAR